jgi:hypothetical protein
MLVSHNFDGLDYRRECLSSSGACALQRVQTSSGIVASFVN